MANKKIMSVNENTEPELRSKFIKKMKQIKKQKSIRINDFAKRYNIKNS